MFRDIAKGVLLVFLFGCSADDGYDTPKPAANDPKEQAFVSNVKPVVIKYCAPCHSGAAFLQSGAAFKASKAQQLVSSGAMPKAGSSQAKSFTASDKQVLLAF
jgi:hypothetical protein